MAGEWTFEELIPNGWHPHWLPTEDPAIFRLEFTLYRSEITRHIIVVEGSHRSALIAEATKEANAWVREHPEYEPKRPPKVMRHDRQLV